MTKPLPDLQAVEAKRGREECCSYCQHCQGAVTLICKHPKSEFFNLPVAEDCYCSKYLMEHYP